MARIFGKIINYDIFRNMFLLNFSEQRNIFIETRIKPPVVLCDLNNNLYLTSRITFDRNIKNLSMLKTISNPHTMSLNNVYDRYFLSGFYAYKEL